MPNTALHGRLRDLALNEVLQLLSFGRKSGTLRVEAPVVGRRARVEFAQGSITDARMWTVDEVEPRGVRTVADIRDVQHVLFEILRWRDGQFRFEASATPDWPAAAVAGSVPSVPVGQGMRLAVDPILVEAARRTERWARIADRVPNTEVIPAFLESHTTSLPLLRLAPSQWEVLTRVDGQRDLHGLAGVLERDVMDVADCVYDLLIAGVLVLRDAAAVPRRNPTPPAVLAIPDPMQPPSAPPIAAAPAPDDPEEDSLFDPSAYDGYLAPAVAAASMASPPVTPSYWPAMPPVASNPVAPSIPQEQEAVIPPDWHGPALCRFGDDLARRGDLRGALAYWHAALRAMVPVADSERVRESIALVSRLLTLLQS